MEARLAKCLLLARVVVADGMVSPEERAFLDAAMARLGLTPEEREKVKELEGFDEAERVVAALGEDEKRDWFETLVDASSIDGRLAALEVATVKKIAKALGLEP